MYVQQENTYYYFPVTNSSLSISLSLSETIKKRAYKQNADLLYHTYFTLWIWIIVCCSRRRDARKKGLLDMYVDRLISFDSRQLYAEPNVRKATSLYKRKPPILDVSKDPRADHHRGRETDPRTAIASIDISGMAVAAAEPRVTRYVCTMCTMVTYVCIFIGTVNNTGRLSLGSSRRLS